MSEKENLEHAEFVKDNSKSADYYKAKVALYTDENGYFTDDILGNSIWPLAYCENKIIDGKMYWKFV